MSLDGFAPTHKTFNTRDASSRVPQTDGEHHVVVPPARFTKPMDILDLAHALFG
jgi:hypothetical protein